MVDLPGTYSLLSNSVEEEVARDFICFGNPQVTVVVTDATSLQRNLNLVLQILEITSKVVVCVNLMDEAKRKRIRVYIDKLEEELGVPVVATSARNGLGLKELKEAVAKVAESSNWAEVKDFKIQYDKTIEEAIDIIKPYLDGVSIKLNTRWASLRLMEGDQTLLEAIKKHIKFHQLDERALSYRGKDRKQENFIFSRIGWG